MPLKGSKLAYYLKKRNPELYEKARRIKELYNLTWDAAIAIAKGEAPPPPPSKLEEIAKSLEELRARVDSIEGLEERIKELENSLRKLRSSLTALEDALKGLKAEVEELVEMRNELLLGLALRSRKEYECKYMDSEGYCTQWVSRERIEGFEMKCVSGMCYINVLKHKWICTLCPAYTPRTRGA